MRRATLKRRGRPRLDPDGPSINVHVRVTAKHYEVLSARAGRERSTLPEMIRRALTEELGTENRRGK
jgi:hypothetical protein